MDALTDRPQRCQIQACALQSCLARHTYAPAKCDEYVRKLYSCCLDMYKNVDGTTSTACPARPVVERWLDETQGGSRRL